MASPRPTAKGKKIFMPYTYCGKTTHASEKCCKEFGKPGWAQAMFSSITPSPNPPTISTPLVGLMKQIDAIINGTPIHVNNNSKITNFVKISRIEGYNGK